MEDSFHDLGGTAVTLLAEAGCTGPSGTAQKIPERNPAHVQRRQVRSGAMIIATKRRKGRTESQRKRQKLVPCGNDNKRGRQRLGGRAKAANGRGSLWENRWGGV